MNSKLTLSLKKEVITAAKKYAKSKNTSLSSLIENYLAKVVTKTSDTKSEISPLVKSLSGVLNVGKQQNLKKDLTDYLAKKYK